MGSGAFLVLVGLAQRAGMADPVPQAMVLTGIVVSVAATALALALARRLHKLSGDCSACRRRTMTEFFDPLVWLILLPLFWASGAFLLGPGRGARLAIAGVAVQLCAGSRPGRKSRRRRDALKHAVGGWGAPLGIDLAADGLAAVMLLLTQVVALPLAALTRAATSPPMPRSPVISGRSTGFLLAGINALFPAADLFNLYVTLELVGLAAVGLVAAGGNAAQIAAGLRYLFATLLGSGAYLLGVALIYGTYGTVSHRDADAPG